MPTDLIRVAAPSSVLALVTTVHVALLLLRQHRSVPTPASAWLLGPPAAFAAMPWLLSTPLWLVSGLAAHLLWYLACERLFPSGVAATARATQSPGRPVAPSVKAVPTASAPRSPAAVAARKSSPDFVPVPVLAVFRETDDVRTIRLARPEGFEFTPGQFVTVRVQVEGRPLVRCYSIASAPHTAGYLEISVKRMGQVSGMLHASARPGALVTLGHPAGSFRYPSADDRPLVLLAGGVGITPLMSMLRHAVNNEPGRPVSLLFSVRDERQVIYRDELEWLRRRHPRADLTVVVTEGPRADWHESGFISEEHVRRHVEDPLGSLFMLCGPPPMMDAAKSLLARMRVPESQVRQEAFDASAAMPALRPAPATAPAAAGSAGATLTLLRSGLSVPLDPRRSLLEVAERVGAPIPSACRAGVCLTCRTRLVSGDADCQSDALDAADREAGFILPCVSWARGDCTLEA
ncbi:MAG: iron-sulfur cluster-binding domain-containing protein [Acidobacteriota bacterium]